MAVDRSRPRPRSALALKEHFMELTYASYLKLDRLLDLQQPRSQPPEHDEMLFIVSHQAYELWFKLQLHELDKIKDDFLNNHLYGAIATFKRARTIMKVMVEQIDILETLTPMSFNSFRDRLDTASGFQSSQFREFEFVLGYKRKEMLRYQQPNTPTYERLVRRLHEPSVVDCFYRFLEQHGVAIPAELRQRDVTEPSVPNETVEEGILRLYKTQPDLEILFELMTDFDEGFQEWRYRHIKLVERSIGSKKGTGGSLGVDFLKQSLFHPVFHDLWAIRHKL
jgi:tryptophan 2,3-dioxygenase